MYDQSKDASPAHSEFFLYHKLGNSETTMKKYIGLLLLLAFASVYAQNIESSAAMTTSSSTTALAPTVTPTCRPRKPKKPKCILKRQRRKNFAVNANSIDTGGGGGSGSGSGSGGSGSGQGSADHNAVVLKSLIESPPPKPPKPAPKPNTATTSSSPTTPTPKPPPSGGGGGSGDGNGGGNGDGNGGGNGGGGGGGSGNGLGWIQKQFLDAHNQVRARHQNTVALEWSTEVEKSAQKWADTCSFKHSGVIGLGENIAWGYFNYPQIGNQITQMFYSEVSKYHWFGKEPNPEAFTEWGHFTQVVWADTTQLGCAVSTCGTNQYFAVCQYRSAGNFAGQYAKNVHPLAQ
jgi:uncharacterized protein YkwD